MPTSTRLNRRELVASIEGNTAAAGLVMSPLAARAGVTQQRQFRVWAICCAHVGTDLRVAKRESLAEAIRQSERGGNEGGPPFDWDIAVNLGDLSGNQGGPTDDEGAEVVRQYSAATRDSRSRT